MPELSRFETLPPTNMAQRKSSNMSTNSDDSLRKISSDSGIGIACSQGIEASARLPNNYDELIGEPRLSTDLSAMLLAQQQSLSAAAALNPAMLGLMSASLGGLFANPLATAMLQQEANARKLLETTASGKPPMMASGAGKGYSREQLSMYPGFAGLIQPPSQVADQLALSEALRSQLLNRKLSEEVNGVGGPHRPTRKANSFSGASSSPLHRQFSPPTSNAASPNLSHNLSPNCRNVTTNSGDEQQSSPYRDDDSVESSKSSARSHTPQSSSQPLDSQPSMASYSCATDGLPSATLLNGQFHPSSRKRKNGIIAGSMPMSDLNSYSLGAFSQPVSNDIPMHKLSTASLPATLPSNSPRVSLIHDPLSNRGSPAMSRKRQRNIHVEEKVGAPREDESYWERRRKNNEAAKRSRDSRRAKEDEIAIRAAFLEQENFKLRLELNKMKEEFSKLQTQIETRKKPEVRDEEEDDKNKECETASPTGVESSQTTEDSTTTATTAS